MSNNRLMLCNGRYVANDPCYPFCSLPDGSGCDYFNVRNPFGKTNPYSVKYKDGFGGYVKKSYIPVIDPYQSITPKDLKFSGANGESTNGGSALSANNRRLFAIAVGLALVAIPLYFINKIED